MRIDAGNNNDVWNGDFVYHLYEDIKKYGLNFNGFETCGVKLESGNNTEQRRGQVTRALSRVYDELAIRLGGPLPLILFILPSKDLTTYADVKWWADCVCGVPTVCITADGVRKAVGRTPNGKSPFDKTRRNNTLDLKVLGNLA